MSDTYQPGAYVKGDTTKVANNKAQAVALVFDGYKLQKDPTPPAKSKKKGVRS